MRFSRTPSSLASAAYKLRPLDVASAALSAPVAFVLRDSTIAHRAELAELLIYCLAGFASGLASLIYFRIGQIDSRFIGLDDVRQCVKAALVAAVGAAALAFMAHGLGGVPRSVPALHGLVFGVLILGVRASAESLRRGGRQGAAAQVGEERRESVIVVGANEAAALYIRLSDSLSGGRTRIAALLEDDAGLIGRCVRGRVVAGPVSAAARILSEFSVHGVLIDRMVIAYSPGARADAAYARLEPLCRERGVALERLGDTLRLSAAEDARAHALAAPAAHAAAAEDAHAAAAEDAHAAAAPAAHAAQLAYWRVRRALDLTLALVGLVVLAPVLVLVALAVLIDVGLPLIFWQERVGRGGRSIFVHKFRTLGAPVSRSGRIRSDAERLSPIGRFLRFTRLDEAPQLFDILRGDMSVIGPRPLLPADMPPDGALRLLAPPGLTGWAQVHGGKLVTPEEKGALDAWYVRNAGPLVDLRILWLTLLAPFRGDRRDEAVLARAREHVALHMGAPAAAMGAGRISSAPAHMGSAHMGSAHAGGAQSGPAQSSAVEASGGLAEPQAA
jgi:lipopolysaccharide/colanic/teichoic acid biosynthesis glycosyltransferase